MELTNRFKGLDLIDRMPEELWMEVHNIVQEVVIKTILKKKKCKKAKQLSEDVMQIAEKRREAKRKGKEERYRHLKGFPGGSDGKASDCNAGDLKFDPWVGKVPWRRKWQPTPVFLPGKSQGQRTLVGCSSWGRKESDTTSYFTFTFYRHLNAEFQ